MGKESIAVVGGGFTGIASALELAKIGEFDVTLFEKEEILGGLSSFYRWNDFTCDRFYHVILPSDARLLEFVRELGLESQLFWRSVKTGFYGENRLISMSSVFDFIRFPFLSPLQKVRMGLGILYSARVKKPAKLDKIYANQWLSKVFGRKVYENIWEPLLRSKLGNATDITSAAFIWAIISRLYGTRHSSKKQERMGHVNGGYHTILKRISQKLKELNVELKTNTTVQKVNHDINQQIILDTDSGSMRFGRILLTISCPEILRIIDSSQSNIYWKRLRDIKYIGIICVLLLLRRKLSPYYVINLLDKNLPFTGVIESTNVISSTSVGDKNLVYLPKYLTDDDLLNDFSDEKIINLFLKNLKIVFPDLHDDEILHIRIIREKYVQPVQEMGYSGLEISFKTPLKNVYLANSSMIYDSTLNNNAVIQLARKAIQTITAK